MRALRHGCPLQAQGRIDLTVSTTAIAETATICPCPKDPPVRSLKQTILRLPGEQSMQKTQLRAVSYGTRPVAARSEAQLDCSRPARSYTISACACHGRRASAGHKLSGEFASEVEGSRVRNVGSRLAREVALGPVQLHAQRVFFRQQLPRPRHGRLTGNGDVNH